MGIRKEYKAQYEESEINDLYAWFESRQDKLPSQFRVDAATMIEDVPFFVRMTIRRVKGKPHSFTTQAYFTQLFHLRNLLKEAGID